MTIPPRLTPDMALFLDFDGTLVEIAEKPDAIYLEPVMAECLLQTYHGLNGALALISGRSIRELDYYLNPTVLPAAGLHGLERRLSLEEGIVALDSWPGVCELKEKLILSGVLHGGVVLEDKGSALAVHYRACPEREADVRGTLCDLAEQFPSLHVIFGNMVAEAKPKGEDKGTAVRRFLEMPVFKNRLPVFIGDDVTDEDGIRAVQELGGYGIKVGEQQSEAAFRLKDVESVGVWLCQTYVERFFEMQARQNLIDRQGTAETG
ncbi:trehalose-phosphatase [Flexibacterium corallicola]|uniref:trehalose-phosphatase n=1 Tax=Flexibacterium corallicola TaxID=3037259 RepID=UPI00286F77FE|nr:trehalose-phosphatase [Pseudovibrio sp. M1P-2-3]